MKKMKVGYVQKGAIKSSKTSFVCIHFVNVILLRISFSFNWSRTVS